jgi:hypothetical protein
VACGVFSGDLIKGEQHEIRSKKYEIRKGARKGVFCITIAKKTRV